MFVKNGAVRTRRSRDTRIARRSARVDEETIYHWASITKTFTGIAIMQLRDRGLLSLDDPAVKYVPGAARGPQPVRRHLAGDDPPSDDAQRRVPGRHVAVGRRSAVASVRADPLGAGGRDDAVYRAAVPAGHEVQLLEPRRHLSRPHHRAVFRRRLRGVHQQEHLHAARHDAQLLRSRAVSPGRAPIAQLRRDRRRDQRAAVRLRHRHHRLERRAERAARRHGEVSGVPDRRQRDRS